VSFARLDTTDAVSMAGADLVQDRDRLEVVLTDGARLTLTPGPAGAHLRVEAGGLVLDLVLAPEVALRIGSHLAALGQRALEPGS
jgi:hypothetical protein